ncbi:hypothetical protein ACFLZ9_00360 [Patescibacteria group bacterium]
MIKISQIPKKIISSIQKIIIAIMMGIGSSFGKNIHIEEKKDNKTIDTNK